MRPGLDGDDPVMLPVVGDPQVFVVLTDRHRQVAGQGPWGGGPDEKEVAWLDCGVALEHLEANCDRRVLDVSIVEVGLEVRQRRGCAPGVGEHFEILIDQALVPQLFEDPPHGLHELGVHRLVVVLEVDPTPDPLGQRLPGLGVGLDPDPASLVEAIDPVIADLTWPGDAELLLDLHLDREPVRVPPESALDPVSPHRPITGDHVLDHAGQQVAVMGTARGEGRAVVEYVFPIGRAAANRFGERIGFTPQGKHRLFQAGDVDRRVDPLESGLVGQCSQVFRVVGPGIVGSRPPCDVERWN